MVKRRVCVVTGSRAEYGLLRHVMTGIDSSPSLELQVVATGMHLAPEFGATWREIENDGFRITRRVEMLLSSDTAVGTTKSTGLGMIGFADVLADLKPDVIVLLGDRFEILAAATAALFAKIPVAHLHGGETTEGAFDEGIRHAITKMSHLHFVAAEDYRRRVLQLGEDPACVFLTGGLGVDAIRHTQLMNQAELEASLEFEIGRPSLLVTWHPETLEAATDASGLTELLAALEQFPDTHCVFTLPNADPGGRQDTCTIQDWVERHSHRARAFVSLGQRRYWSLMALVDGVVGNSSSGLLEAPTFQIGTVNIGRRQQGRLMAESVLSVAPRRAEIREAIETLYSDRFRLQLAMARNPYGDGGASERIVQVLETFPLDRKLLRKTFFDRFGRAAEVALETDLP